MKFKKICSVLMSAVVTASYFLQGITVTANNEELHNQNVSTVNDDFSIDGNNSFGNLIASGIENEMADKEENNGCKIYSLEMNGNTAKVSFDTTVDCSLVVAIYDDAGEKMLISGMSEISSSKTSVEIPIDIDVMPEYFYLKAYMVDSKTLSPVCSVYENPNYTSVMKDFFDKTTDDFDAERVINFNDDITNNFAVYGEDTKIIEYSDSVNVLTDRDDTTGTYVFENVDEKISALQPNDIFTYNCGGDEDVIIKVKTISMNGTTAVITANETSLDEVFEYVKIEEVMGQNEAEFDTEGVPDVVYSDFDTIVDDDSENLPTTEVNQDVSAVSSNMKPMIYSLPKKTDAEYSEDIDVEFDDGKINIVRGRSVKVSFLNKEDEYNNNEIKDDTILDDKILNGKKSNVVIKTSLTGELTYKSDLSLKIYIDSTTHESSSDDINFFEVKWAQSLDVDVKFNSKDQLTVSLFRMRYAFKGFTIEWIPKFVVEASVEMNLNGNFSGTLGYKVTDNGCENISEKPKFSAYVKIEGEFAVGIDLGPSFYFISDFIAKVDTEMSLKFEIISTTSLLEGEYSPFDDEPKDEHDCLKIDDNPETGCLMGQIDAVVTLSAEGKLFNNDKLKLKLESYIPIHLFDFYYSLKNKKLGIGNCPYKHYYYNLTVNDRYGKPINEAKVSVLNAKTKTETSYITDDKGKVTVYLTDGSNSITFEKEKFDKITKEFKVSVTKNSSPFSFGYDFNKDENDKDDEDMERRTARFIKVNDKTSRDNIIELDPVMYPVKVNAVDKNGKAVNALFGTSYEFNDNSNTSLIVEQSSYTLKLPEGTWDITATPTESYYEKQIQSVTVNEGDENIEITFTFEDTRAGATIILTDQYGKPVPDASVNIEKIGESKLIGKLPTTDENGIYTTNLSKGDYEITLTKGGYETVTQTFTVGDEPLNVEITISSDAQTTTENSLKFKEISLGYFHSAAISENGSLYMWGLNERGQLGNGESNILGDDVNKNPCYSSIPIKVMDNVKTVSLGGRHSAAVTEDGSLYMWGDNAYGQLGNGTTENSPIPLKIMDNVKSVSLGAWFSAAITEDGSLYMWGDNLYGQIGNGTTESSLIPLKIMNNVKEIELGRSHSMAITEDEHLYTWGYNAYGQLGNGTTENSLIPLKIMDDVKSGSLGGWHSAIITKDGSLYMWGDNEWGQLGNGTTKNSLIPLKIMNNVEIINLGVWCSAIVTGDGDLYNCGYNYDGQIGNGESGEYENGTDLFVTKAIKIMNNVKFISLGEWYSSAITEDGILYMWGNNEVGQFGNGTTENSSIPIKINNIDNYKMIDLEDNITPTPSLAPPIMRLPETSATDITTISTGVATKNITDLKPNTVYNFYSMKSREAENPLSAENLLYISQAVSDENGSLNISYIPKEETEASEEFVANMIYDIKYSDVTIEDQNYTGEEITPTVTVKYNGNLLAESTDYEFSVVEKPLEPGVYTVMISGIGNYYGDKAVSFRVVCKHEYVDGVCSVCGQKKPDNKGDINNDDVIDVSDMILLGRYLAGGWDDISINDTNSDVNNDGNINIADLVMIGRCLAGGWDIELK